MVHTQQVTEYKSVEGSIQERPWGSYKILHEQDGYKIKRLYIQPNEKTSLQKHMHRSEHWLIESGVAKITIGEQVLYLLAGASLNVAKEMPHRIENDGTEILTIFEVQFGEIIDENDIIRLDDKYGRE